ncbi:MAG: hypothetical protein IKG98_10990 [Ruminococcus sp.]|nr:hypothetical protein [Ruminococcus sp.]MCR5017072.1 hypothetical protein [Ruminococcus sp.]
MTSATINALDASPLPTWLTVLIMVAIFIAVSVISGCLTYKYRVKRRKGVQDSNENESAE